MLVVKSVTANAAVLLLFYKRIIQFMLIFFILLSIIGLIYTNNALYMLCANLVLQYAQHGQHSSTVYNHILYFTFGSLCVVCFPMCSINVFNYFRMQLL